MFIKYDLRTGDILHHRNGEVSIVIIELNTAITKDSWFDLNRFTSGLSYGAPDGREFDIMEVRRPTRKEHCQFDAIRYSMGDLMYKRKER